MLQKFSRCVRKPNFCDYMTAHKCKDFPVHISWQHIAIPKQVNISSHRTYVTLFSMKGPSNPNTVMQFELRLVNTQTGKKTYRILSKKSNRIFRSPECHHGNTQQLFAPERRYSEFGCDLLTRLFGWTSGSPYGVDFETVIQWAIHREIYRQLDYLCLQPETPTGSQIQSSSA